VTVHSFVHWLDCRAYVHLGVVRGGQHIDFPL
jgi:hypothetical protein